MQYLRPSLCALGTLLLLFAGSTPVARAEPGDLSLHLEFGAGVPTAGYLAPLGTRDYTAHVGFGGFVSLDYVVRGPFALELIGGVGRFYDVYANNPFLPSAQNDDGFNFGSVGLGARLRFLEHREDAQTPQNLWLSGHVNFAHYSGNQLHLDGAIGYEWTVASPFSFGVFLRGLIGFAGEGRPWIEDEHNTNAALFLGFSGSIRVVSGEASEDAETVSDADGDGITNVDDLCVSVPEDLDGFEDSDGCPDADDDRDGVPDPSDRCPSLPEDRDAHEDDDGCPDTDDDGDGVADGEDRCPDDQGTAEDRGCPAVPIVAEPQPAVARVAGDRIDVGERVHFRLGSAALDPESQAVLDEIAALLRDHPEIQHLSVEGHTDETGSAARNQLLSARRAHAVVEYLIFRGGIDASRLRARGFSASRLSVEDAREHHEHRSNRRVEFVIVSE